MHRGGGGVVWANGHEEGNVQCFFIPFPVSTSIDSLAFSWKCSLNRCSHHIFLSASLTCGVRGRSTSSHRLLTCGQICVHADKCIRPAKTHAHTHTCTHTHTHTHTHYT